MRHSLTLIVSPKFLLPQLTPTKIPGELTAF
jgi:hypothetical protein